MSGIKARITAYVDSPPTVVESVMAEVRRREAVGRIEAIELPEGILGERLPPAPTTHLGMCECGMEYAGKPHLCLQWHPTLMRTDAMAELSAVVRKYMPETGRPVVTVNLTSPDTQAFIRHLVRLPHQKLVAWEEPVPLHNIHNDEGQRVTISFPLQENTYGVTKAVFTVTDDPEWVESFAKKHHKKEPTMPLCCDKPDPRISKTGRPYCANCKKYLDRVPQPGTMARKEGEA
jgi:hypothetical protein